MHHFLVTWKQGTESRPSAGTTNDTLCHHWSPLRLLMISFSFLRRHVSYVPLCFGICHDHSRLSLAFCFTGGCIATASRIQAFSDFIIITMGRLSSFRCHLHQATVLLGWLLCFCSWAGCLHFQIAKSFCVSFFATFRYIDDDD